METPISIHELISQNPQPRWRVASTSPVHLASASSAYEPPGTKAAGNHGKSQKTSSANLSVWSFNSFEEEESFNVYSSMPVGALTWQWTLQFTIFLSWMRVSMDFPNDTKYLYPHATHLAAQARPLLRPGLRDATSWIQLHWGHLGPPHDFVTASFSFLGRLSHDCPVPVTQGTQGAPGGSRDSTSLVISKRFRSFWQLCRLISSSRRSSSTPGGGRGSIVLISLVFIWRSNFMQLPCVSPPFPVASGSL